MQSPDGAVLDPLLGLPDLQARRVRFIGTAENRIREDYLRSLRYFRFHAWYGDAEAGFDPDALSAIAENLDGLVHLVAGTCRGGAVETFGRARSGPFRCRNAQHGCAGAAFTGRG